MELFGKRLYLRRLNPDFDNLDNYLSWLRDINNNKFIESAKEDYSKEELIEYINSKNNSAKALLLGIFENHTCTLFGTIKLEPVDLDTKTGWVGILIGDPNNHGKGYGFESLDILFSYCASILKIEKIFLGVSPNNFPALKLYEKLGFLPNSNKKNVMYLDIVNYKSKL
jgi:RimJ/RimL family protein N-acetyltransferase